ncbi:MAG: hydrogenase maturation protease [Anaerolineae bacterium]
MSNEWSNQVHQSLVRLKANKPLRVAIMGIGHELMGDDAAGIIVVRSLELSLAHRADVLILEGGTAPENQTGVLRRFSPQFVVLVDAINVSELKSRIRWLKWQDVRGIGTTTHALPLYVIAQYLERELHCEVGIIGIQTVRMKLGEGLSSGVNQLVNEVVQSLVGLLQYRNLS